MAAPDWDGEHGMLPWARAAVVTWGVVSFSQAVAGLASAHSLRRWVHSLGTYPVQTGRPVLLPFGLQLFVALADLGLLAAAIGFLLWQHRAATNARALGYPARTSPGFGVGSWFIPVINLWYPYWALRDCLPTAHPWARRMPWVWVGYFVAGALNAATAAAAYFSAPAGVLLLVISAGATLVVATSAWTLLGMVDEDHARALGVDRR